MPERTGRHELRLRARVGSRGGDGGDRAAAAWGDERRRLWNGAPATSMRDGSTIGGRRRPLRLVRSAERASCVVIVE